MTPEVRTEQQHAASPPGDGDRDAGEERAAAARSDLQRIERGEGEASEEEPGHQDAERHADPQRHAAVTPCRRATERQEEEALEEARDHEADARGDPGLDVEHRLAGEAEVGRHDRDEHHDQGRREERLAREQREQREGARHGGAFSIAARLG